MAPVYEYECQACGARAEQVRKMSDPPLASCPECGGQVRRVFGAASAPAPADVPAVSDAPAVADVPPGAPALDIKVPWTPTETDIHREWKQRRKWKRDLMARNKWNERMAGRGDPETA